MAPIILIFGTSHVGKSTLANRLGDRLGWRVQSTDEMGRHPGRPWPEVREPVAEHYTCLSDETIYWFLKVHQDNIWPFVRQQITDASILPQGSIFEGSALRPEFLATLHDVDLLPLGLHTEDAFLRARILKSSGYAHQDEGKKILIDKFIRRSLRQNADCLDVATNLGLQVLDAADENELAVYTEKLVSELNKRARF